MPIFHNSPLQLGKLFTYILLILCSFSIELSDEGGSWDGELYWGSRWKERGTEEPETQGGFCCWNISDFTFQIFIFQTFIYLSFRWRLMRQRREKGEGGDGKRGWFIWNNSAKTVLVRWECSRNKDATKLVFFLAPPILDCLLVALARIATWPIWYCAEQSYWCDPPEIWSQWWPKVTEITPLGLSKFWNK